MSEQKRGKTGFYIGRSFTNAAKNAIVLSMNEGEES